MSLFSRFTGSESDTEEDGDNAGGEGDEEIVETEEPNTSNGVPAEADSQEEEVSATTGAEEVAEAVTNSGVNGSGSSDPDSLDAGQDVLQSDQLTDQTDGESDDDEASSGGILSYLPFVGGNGESEDEESPEGLETTVEFQDLFGEELSNTSTSIDLEKSSDDEEIASDEDSETTNTTEFLAHVDDPDITKEDYLGRVEKLHQRKIAPSEIEKGPTSVKVGSQYRRVLFASEFPEATPVGGLKSIIEDPSLHFDLTVHFQPNDREDVASSAEDLANTLEASAEVNAEGEDNHAASDKLRRMRSVNTFRNEIVENNERPCTMSMYLSARADDKETLADNVDEIRDTLKRDSGIVLETVERKQQKALVSASPVGLDPLRDKDMQIDPTHVGLGKSVGALFASLSEGRKFNPEGHEWGVHSVQGHPIIEDPFDSPTNYNMVCVGESGSGKSVNMKRMALQAKATNEDSLIIISDPLKGFEGLAEALDAKKITVGGKRPFNPMEIRKPPEEYINSAAFDEMAEDPLSKKVDDVMAFLINFAGQQPGLEIGEESQLLRSIIITAYKQKGITTDVRTHGKESPTLSEVTDLVKEAQANPEQWTRDIQDPSTVKAHADSLATLLREFNGDGQYTHLAKGTEDDPFEGSDVIYLDLSQEESSGGSSIGVMGQLMFSLAYEKCKQYPGPALYIVDEARHLFSEQDTLEYLAQRNRHSRHYDTSIRFITQEMADFFGHPASEGIVNNSAIEVIHKSKSVEDWGHKFDLNENHMRFVKNAATGDEMPYSQALVRFPDSDQWYPINVEIGEREMAVVDFDEQEDDYNDLPGRSRAVDVSPVARELQARIRDGDTDREEALEELFEPWEREVIDVLGYEELDRCLRRIENGENPRRALYIEALEKIETVLGIAGAPDDVSFEVVRRLKEGIKEQVDEEYSSDLSKDSPTQISGQSEGIADD